MKNLVLILTLFAIVGTGCESQNNGNTSVGGVHFTHDELAQDFVDSVNRYLGHDFDLELKKAHTKRNDYIVVYNHDSRRYEAYWLGDYNPGESIDEYINDKWNRFYFGLEKWGNTYVGWDYDPFIEDWVEIEFQETAATSKDLVLMNALQEKLVVDKLSEKLQLQLSLSTERSRKWAEAMYFVDQSQSVTPEQVDNISSELLGFRVSDLSQDIQNGNVDSIEDKIAQAGILNDGMSPEQVNTILNSLFEGQK